MHSVNVHVLFDQRQRNKLVPPSLRRLTDCISGINVIVQFICGTASSFCTLLFVYNSPGTVGPSIVYLQRISLYLPPPSLISQCTRLHNVPGTHNVGLPHPIPVQCWPSAAAHCWFNAGQSYSTLTQHLGQCIVFAGFALPAVRMIL